MNRKVAHILIFAPTPKHVLSDENETAQQNSDGERRARGERKRAPSLYATDNRPPEQKGPLVLSVSCLLAFAAGLRHLWRGVSSPLRGFSSFNKTKYFINSVLVLDARGLKPEFKI